jgi:hypothetical protein
MITRYILVAMLSLSGFPGGEPWEKAPAKWDLGDVFRILQDSPWCPAGVKVETKRTSSPMDPKTGLTADASATPVKPGSVPGVQISRSKAQAAIPVLWWSSKTVRLAQQRLNQLRNPSLANEPLRADDLPDYVLVIEGSEPIRIIRDAKEDLHDTVFLELPGGATLDLDSVRFLEGSEEQESRVEFHFLRQMDGRATIDADSERVVLHCKASAKTDRPFQENAVSFRAEFKPRAMRIHGVPDL